MKTEILYEDGDILVCYKPAGLATQTRQIGQIDVESELRNYLAGAPLYLIHRLDQPVEGILAFAKTKTAAASLGRQLGSEEMNKSYLAVVFGRLPQKGTLKDYMRKEPKGNVSRIVSEKEKDAKYAELSYEVLAEKSLAEIGCVCSPALPQEVLSLVRIRLKTGRHHQIRVQLANAGHALLGDSKYAAPQVMQLSGQLGIRSVALCAHALRFVHPVSKENRELKITPKGLSFQIFRDILNE